MGMEMFSFYEIPDYGSGLVILPLEAEGVTSQSPAWFSMIETTQPLSGWRFFLKTQLRVYIQSAKTRPGADCGSDHELLIAKFRLKLKKIGKTTRLFRYDLNQIPYDYTVEVRNRFKGLDLIDCLMNYGWRFMILYRRQGARPSPRKRNAKKQTGCLRRLYKYL